MDDYSNLDGMGGYAAFMTFMAVFGVVMFIIAIAGYVLTAWFLMKVFDKAGVEGRWRAWIPFYNMMVFMKLGDVNPWLLFFALATVIPYIGWIGSIFASVMVIIAAYRVGLKLQKEGAWVVLYIFLPIVWLGICAFDGSRWNHQVPAPSWAGNGFIGDKQVWAGIPTAAPAGYAQPGYGQAPYGQPEQPGYPPQPYGGQPQPPQQPGAAPQPPADPNQPPQPPTDPNQPRPPQPPQA